MAHSHSHDGPSHSHSHDHGAANEHGHTHEIMEHPGKFTMRDMPTYDKRNWKERAFTVGIGGPVGSGKSALLLALCRHFRDRVNLGVVTNDIFTREDQEFLIRNEALADKDRIRSIETGRNLPLSAADEKALTRDGLSRRLPTRSNSGRYLRKPGRIGRATSRLQLRDAARRKRRRQPSCQLLS